MLLAAAFCLSAVRPPDSGRRLTATTKSGARSASFGAELLQRPAARIRELLRSDAARHLIAGAAAGIVSNTAVAPLDILRLNVMCDQGRTNARRMARDIYARGGVRAFWQGNSADVLRTIPASALRFYTFALYKARRSAPHPGTPLATRAPDTVCRRCYSVMSVQFHFIPSRYLPGKVTKCTGIIGPLCPSSTRSHHLVARRKKIPSHAVAAVRAARPAQSASLPSPPYPAPSMQEVLQG